jgi:FMN phosphatase YigB (HAD superfamily)
VHRVLREQGLHGYFKTIVISGEVGFKKPDPRIFRHALEETRLSPEEAVYVGDTEEDVQGAKGAGMTPILIARSETGTDPGLLDYTKDNASRVSWPATRTYPVATIAHLRELIAVIT